MSEIKHTESCQQAHAQAEATRAAYAAKWPNHCPTCEGHGGHWYSFDPSPSGISLAAGTMEDFDACPDCLEKGVCPRCGQEVWTADDWDGNPVTCPLCGWDEASPDGMPPEAECWCWEAQNDAALALYERTYQELDILV